MAKKILSDLTLEITNQCNLRCKLCNIWEEKSVKNLSLENIKNIFSYFRKNYFISFVSITGGEPFLHPQFNKIYNFLILLKLKKNIENIGIYSNGYATEKIINFLGKHKDDKLYLGISLDGTEKTHNLLRGKNNAFAKTIATIERAKFTFPFLNLEIKFTISPMNYKEILTLYKYCRKENFIFTPKFAEKNVKYYYHRNNNIFITNQIPVFNIKERKEIKNILNEIYNREKLAKNKITDLSMLKMLEKIIIYGKTAIQTCLTPSKTLFIACSGDVHPCIYFKAIGNLNRNWKKKFMGSYHKKIIEKAQNGTCPKCFAYHGFLRDFNLSKNL